MHWQAVWKIFAIHTTYISVMVLRPSFTNIKEKSSFSYYIIEIADVKSGDSDCEALSVDVL